MNCTYAVTGLSDAQLLIYVPKAFFDRVEIMVNYQMLSSDQMEKNEEQCTILLKDITGNLQVSW